MNMELLKEIELHTLGTVIKNKDTLALMDLRDEHFLINTNLYKAINTNDFSIASIAAKSGLSMEEIGNVIRMATSEQTLQDNIMQLKNHNSKLKYETFLVKELEKVAANLDATRMIDESIMKLQAIPTATKTASTDLEAISREFMSYITDSINGTGNRLLTSLTKFNKILGGFQNGDFIIIAARPSVGKSMLASQIGIEVAAKGHKVLFFNLEETNRKLYQRLIAKLTRITVQRQNEGDLDQNDIEQIEKAKCKINKLPMIVNNKALTVADMRREMIIQKPEMVIIDQISKMNGPGSNETEVVLHISKALTQLALELNIPIIAANQINREGARDNGPRLDNLAGSDRLGADANTALMMSYADFETARNICQSLTKDEYDEIIRNGCEFINMNVEKNRQGLTGNMLFVRDGARFTFLEWTSGIGATQEFISQLVIQ